MNRKKLAWMLGTKLALTFGLTLPLNFRGPAEYWTLATLPGLEPGAPVTLGGQIIGRVVAKRGRGDTTFLRVQFNRNAHRLPGSRVVQLTHIGLGGERVILEMRARGRSRFEPFTRGGRLRVIPNVRHRDRKPETVAPLIRVPPPPPSVQLIPLAPPVSRRAPLVSA